MHCELSIETEVNEASRLGSDLTVSQRDACYWQLVKFSPSLQDFLVATVSSGLVFELILGKLRAKLAIF